MHAASQAQKDVYLMFKDFTLLLWLSWVSAFRESLYRLLPQTTPENIAKNFDQYTIDPGTRYPNLNSNCVRPHQVHWTLVLLLKGSLLGYMTPA